MNRRCGRAMNPLPRQATPVMAPVTMVGDEGGDSDQPRCNIRNCKTLDDNITERVPQANKQKYGKVASGLGDLDKLPLEVQSNILVHLDLQTLVNFRRVNRQAREVVDALPEYQKILHFSPTSLLRSIFTIQLEAFITCQALVTTLNTQKCEDCGDPSEYIHLLTCRRVCCHCLLSRGEYKSTTLECAEWEFQVPRRLLEGLPTMKAVAGRYAKGELLYPFRPTFVDRSSASMAGSAYRAEKTAALRRTRSGQVVLPVVGTAPKRTIGFAYQQIDDSRFTSVVRAPWVKRPNEIFEPVFCACGVLSSCPASVRRGDRGPQGIGTILRRMLGRRMVSGWT
jgi:hypothetical protein